MSPRGFRDQDFNDSRYIYMYHDIHIVITNITILYKMCCSCTGHILTVMSPLRERLVWNAWGLQERSTPHWKSQASCNGFNGCSHLNRANETKCSRSMSSEIGRSSSSKPSHTKEHLPCRSQTLTICAGKSGWRVG